KNKYVCGYVVAHEEVDAVSLQRHLSKELPVYMLPDKYLFLETLPLTSNGKINRKALPEPETSDSNLSVFIAPSTDLEVRLSKVWQELLNIERIGIHDNF